MDYKNLNSKLKALSKYFLITLCALPLLSLKAQTGKLTVSANKRFIQEDGKPFFWLGDTGWLLFSKLNRQEAEKYLDVRKQQGFNVIQVMVLHDIAEVNAYGDSALIRKNITRPLISAGNNPSDGAQYDYWDHVDYIIDLAEKRGIFMALVPVWGSVAKEAKVSGSQGAAYATFLAKRYGSRSNIIWMNGGDIKGSECMETWKAIGNTINSLDSKHLITYHPRGRTTSSDWFHNEKWLDFNSFQSGHRRYDQDTTKNEKYHFGEDNWKFVINDFKFKPAKPTIDAEPSYEGIPQGLHDTLEVRWKDYDVRRYGYWSVFAGGFGYTYGNNSVMQFLKAGEKTSAYGAKELWSSAINNPGAEQMVHLKKLMLSRPFLERVPDQTLIVAGKNGIKYNRLLATRGKAYAFVYAYNGRNIPVQLGKIAGAKVKASWFDPRTGKSEVIGTFANTGAKEFDAPGEVRGGNDWVLVLDGVK